MPLHADRVWATRRYPGLILLPRWITAFGWPFFLILLGLAIAAVGWQVGVIPLKLAALPMAFGLVWFFFKLFGLSDD